MLQKKTPISLTKKPRPLILNAAFYYEMVLTDTSVGGNLKQALLSPKVD
ncbi:hypothetical protein BH09BAC4_BH09BAC4_22560 [soil metagenome]